MSPMGAPALVGGPGGLPVMLITPPSPCRISWTRALPGQKRGVTNSCPVGLPRAGWLRRVLRNQPKSIVRIMRRPPDCYGG
jgi:hypothetical protein